MSEIRDVLSTQAAARLLNVSPRTVQRWADNGTLRPAYRLDGETGALLFHEADVRDLAEKRSAAA